jgi:DNA-binding transcriptional MocR family regulator
VKALVVIPRAQNPTGAAFDERRIKELAAVLRGAPNVLVIEDDFLGLLFDAPPCSLSTHVPRWMHVRSVAKPLGPDLRVAMAVGDALTMERMEHRQRLSAGWVSWILQETVAAMLSDPAILRRLKTVGKEYWSRQERLARRLRARGIDVRNGPGFTVWIPVSDELRVVNALEAAGWAVDAGTRYRFDTEPGIRVVTTTMEDEEAERFAAAVDSALHAGARLTP